MQKIFLLISNQILPAPYTTCRSRICRPSCWNHLLVSFYFDQQNTCILCIIIHSNVICSTRFIGSITERKTAFCLAWCLPSFTCCLFFSTSHWTACVQSAGVISWAACSFSELTLFCLELKSGHKLHRTHTHTRTARPGVDSQWDLQYQQTFLNLFFCPSIEISFNAPSKTFQILQWKTVRSPFFYNVNYDLLCCVRSFQQSINKWPCEKLWI